jgi:tetratricopeptide (TPR) repeat protein
MTKFRGAPNGDRIGLPFANLSMLLGFASIVWAASVDAAEAEMVMVAPSAAYTAAYEAGDFRTSTRLAKTELDACRARTDLPPRSCYQLWNELLDSGLYAQDDVLVEVEGLAFLAAAETTDGPDSEAMASASGLLASLYLRRGRYEEAAVLRARDIAITRKLFGPEHPDLAISLGNEGVLLDYMGRYKEAEDRYRQSIAIAEKGGEESAPLLASQFNNLARNLDNQGRLEESAALSARVIELQSRLYPATHPVRATTLHNRAIVLRQLNRFDEAETLSRESYGIYLERLGPDSRDTRRAELGLAKTLATLGRPRAAEQLFLSNMDYARRLAPAREQPFTLVAYADFLVSEGRPGEAIPLLREALSVLDTSSRESGADPALIAKTRLTMAETLQASGRLEEAEVEARQALAGFVTANALLRLDIQAALASILAQRDKRGEAITLYRAVLPGYEKLLPAAHCQTLNLRAGLAKLLARDPATLREALTLLEAAAAQSLTRETIDSFGSAGGLGPGKGLCNIAETEIDVVAALLDAGQMSEGEAALRSFAAAQRAHRSAAIRARDLVQATISAGDDRLAAFERERFLLARQIVKDERYLIRALRDNPDGKDHRYTATSLAEARLRFDTLSHRIRADYPDYEVALRPVPLDTAALRRDLRRDEALLLTLPTEHANHMWLVTSRGIWWRRAGLSTEQFDGAIASLNASLKSGSAEIVRGQMDTRGAGPGAFDRDAADRLGQDLFGPFGRQLAEIRSLRVVQSGPLAHLPLSLLRWDGDWIVDRFRITRLPSVASITAGNEPGLAAGGIVALGAVGSADPSLPLLVGAERQLDDLARIFGAAATVRKGEAATKGWLATAPEVASAAVIIFATHSTRLPGPVVEPALQLAPEAGATANDGLLSLTDIGSLRLDHPLIVLTACDTATAMPGDADPLSSFARAFFLARARNLLVSHWPLDDAAAHVQMREFFSRVGADPGIDLADALRESAIALRDDPSGRWRHPRYWAALSYVAGGPGTPADSGAKRTATINPPPSRSAK